MLIAQIAYDNLDPKAKQKANQLADLVFNQLPQKMQEQLNQNYPSASSLAKIALLPDKWRQWKLETIFERFNAPLPKNLTAFKNQKTQT